MKSILFAKYGNFVPESEVDSELCVLQRRLSWAIHRMIVFLLTCFRNDQIKRLNFRPKVIKNSTFHKMDYKRPDADLVMSWVQISAPSFVLKAFFFLGAVSKLIIKIHGTICKAEQCANLCLKHLYLFSVFLFFNFYSFCIFCLFVSGCDGRTCLSCCSLGRRRGVTDCLEVDLVTTGRRTETEVHIDKSADNTGAFRLRLECCWSGGMGLLEAECGLWLQLGNTHLTIFLHEWEQFFPPRCRSAPFWINVAAVNAPCFLSDTFYYKPQQLSKSLWHRWMLKMFNFSR